MAYSSIRKVYEDLGAGGEQAVANLLRQRGHTVRLDGGNHYHDIVIDGSTTVEVKTALPSARDGNRHDRWQFNLFKNDGQHQPMKEDVLVLRCQLDRNGGGGAHHYVIPGCLLPDSLTKIDITQHPTRYGGRYCLFLEAWDLLDAIVALRNRDGYQVSLPEPEKVPF